MDNEIGTTKTDVLDSKKIDDGLNSKTIISNVSPNLENFYGSHILFQISSSDTSTGVPENTRKKSFQEYT